MLSISNRPENRSDAGVSPLRLRDYQQDMLARIIASYAERGAAMRLLAQLPTGGGKTEIIIAWCRWLQREQGRHAIVLTHRRNLVAQTRSRFAGYGIDAAPGSGPGAVWRQGEPPPADVILTLCVQTWRRRMEQPDYGEWNDRPLVIDEAHWYGGRSSWTQVAARHAGPVAGFTATPRRAAPDEGYGPPEAHFPADGRSAGPWTELVAGPQTADLIARGLLSDYRLLDLPTLFPGFRPVEGRRHRDPARAAADNDLVDAAGTWRDASRRGQRSALTVDAVRLWRDCPDAAGRPTLCFALSVDHARALRDCFVSAGYAAAVIHGGTPEAERERLLADFRAGRLRALVSVNILREGFDAPSASCALILRPTASLAFYRQMVGRALRPAPGKTSALILDLAENHRRPGIGLPDAAVAWTLLPPAALETADADAGESDADSDADDRPVPFRVCARPARLDRMGRYLQPGPSGAAAGSDPHRALTTEPCGAVSHPSAHFCRGCGAAFGRICPGAPNGCGLFRFWPLWSGAFRAFRPGACDPCGAEARRLRQAERSAQAAQALRQKRQRAAGADLEPLWQPATTGNGYVLRVAGGSFWIGHQKGALCGRFFLDQALRRRPDLLPLEGLLAERMERGGGAAAGRSRRVENAIAEGRRNYASAAAVVIGRVCGVCRRNFHSAALNSCPKCRNAATPVGPPTATATAPEAARPTTVAALPLLTAALGPTPVAAGPSAAPAPAGALNKDVNDAVDHSPAPPSARPDAAAAFDADAVARSAPAPAPGRGTPARPGAGGVQLQLDGFAAAGRA